MTFGGENKFQNLFEFKFWSKMTSVDEKKFKINNKNEIQINIERRRILKILL